MNLTADQLEEVHGRYKNLPVAVFVPACRGAFTRPEVDEPFTLPQAIALAEQIRDAAGDPGAALVIVYGVPWTTRHAQKPAQGA